MDGSGHCMDFILLRPSLTFGSVYALDFDWNVTTLGGINGSFPLIILMVLSVE